MGSPIIFSGPHAKLLTKDAVTKDGQPLSFNGIANYIKNCSATLDVNGIHTDGSITVTRDTSSSVPCETTDGTAFKIVSAANGAWIEWRFTLDNTDIDKMLGLYLSFNAEANWNVSVWSNTSANYDGTSTRVPLSTDSSSVSAIPALIADYASSFTTSSIKYLSLRLTHTTTNSNTLYVSGLLVTAGTVIQSMSSASPGRAGFIQTTSSPNAVAGWPDCDGTAYKKALYPDLYAEIGDTYATCINTATGSAYSAPASDEFRVPDYRGVFVRGTGTASGLSAVTLGGYQADDLKSHQHSISTPSGGGSNVGLVPSSDRSTSLGATMPVAGMSFPRADPVGGTETRPRNVGVRYIIKAWNDTVVNVGVNTPLYLSYDGSSTVQSAYGSLVPSISAATGFTSHSITLPRPLRTGEIPVLYLSNGGNGFTANYYEFLSGNNGGATNFYGIRALMTDSMTCRVDFGNQGTRVAASNVTAGDAPWTTERSNGTRYVVGITLAGQPQGFGLASATSAGLISREETGSISGTTSSAATVPYTVTYAKVGRVVTLVISVNNFTPTATAYIRLSVSSLPASVRPPNPSIYRVICSANAGGNIASRLVSMDNGSTLDIYGSETASNWTAVSTAIQQFSITYIL